jgi:ectoine hydroxylase-related dioxygenase (phytanoyl-CoA dioxygenase family)
MQSNSQVTWSFPTPESAAFAHFAQHGFVVIESVLDDAAVAGLRNAIARATESNSVHQRAGVTYGMRNLLDQVPAIQNLANSPALRTLVEPVLGRDAFPTKGTLFDKTPDANWKVAWHQDTTICVRERIEVAGFDAWSVKDGVVNVQPPDGVLSSIMTIRLHLDDCGADNGALRVLPGSHNAGRLSDEHIDRWRTEYTPVTCAVRRGGALLMQPLTLHGSSAAQNPGHRRVIHLEFAAIDLPDGLAWAVNSCPGTVRAAL